MGADTRQQRAVYRESGMMRVDSSGIRQWISAFFITTSMSVAMLGGATKFDSHPQMQAWLRWAAAVVFVLGSLGIGARLIIDGMLDLQRLRNPRIDVASLPAHIRPSRGRAIARLSFGILLAVVIPTAIVIAQLT